MSRIQENDASSIQEDSDVSRIQEDRLMRHLSRKNGQSPVQGDASSIREITVSHLYREISHLYREITIADLNRNNGSRCLQE